MTPQNILVVRLGSMGDVLHAMPAVAALRQSLLDSKIDSAPKISWVIDPQWSPLLRAASVPDAVPGSAAMPLVDRIHIADTRAWVRRPISIATLRSIFILRHELHAASYDAALDLQGSIRSAVISRFACNQNVIGSATPREVQARWLYSTRVATRSEHVIAQAAEIASAACGHALTPRPAPLPHDPESESWCAQWLANNTHSRFAVITPGAGWGAKRWPAERYGAVAAGLADFGLTTLVNCGPGESSLAAEVVSASGGHARSIEGTLSQLIPLLRHATIFIGGDTGPLHLAAALGIPVVGLYGPTDPARNGPWGTRAIVLRHHSSYRDHTRRAATEPGLLEIPVAAALDAARTLLQQSNGEPCMTILQHFESSR
jgi:heptosyltransferase-1